MAAKIKPTTTLEHSLEIYVPTQCRCGKPLPENARTEILDEIKTTMAGWFGGNSAKRVDPRVERIEGSWVLGDGTLAKEPVDVVQSFTDEDTLIDHREDFTAFVAQLANRLTQEQMLCRIDGKSILYPSAADPKPHRCAGGVTSTAMPKPREAGETERMLSLQASLQRLGSTNDVRDLFCNILHYDYENGIVPTTAWPDAVKQCLAPGVPPQIVADQNGFKVIYLQLATDSLRKSSERQLVQRLIKDNPGMRGLVVVSDIDQKHWNLVNVKFDRDGKNRDKILLRRMRVGPGQPVRTAVERLSQVDVELLGEDASAADLQDKHDKAFDVEAVTKQFFNDVANWYFWALKHAQFPKDAPKEDDGHDHVSLIRLITRLIFCWFLREKGLIPDTLFDRRQLNDILTGFAPDKVRNKDSVFYRAILQNLFFATLSTEMDKRKWASEEQNFMAHSLYRFKDCFQKPTTALNLFKSIPFLNGGLFECLDRDLGEGKKPRYIRIDGFSRRSDSQPVVPDFLFFGPEKEIDLSAEYGDRRFRNVRVRGLIDTLRHYNFTIEENTPIEEEVALDPELCGKVFENLLAAYNPETGTTARKQSGSFYTPREIVNYMVDEALIASLSTKLEAAVPSAKDIEPRLRHLFAYNDEPHQFDKKETKALIAAIDNLKTLDPAVGSGAFPMGLLHKLVFILGKLDARNEQWKERQIARVREAIAVAEKIEDDTVRSRTVEDLEQQVVNVNESFDRNELDYGRKLYLIENCIYGVDIQPIAVQIAKMRFFISLIVDQKIDDSLPNRGIRPLPNLETKFVAANSLIGINRPGQQMLRNETIATQIQTKEAELRRVRDRHFLARTPRQKSKCRDEDARLRSEISNLLQGDGWDTITAFRLSSWNPYDQNISADFYDSEWMFGVSNGFDIVIGNPPFGADLSGEQKEILKDRFDYIVERIRNSYLYFIGLSFEIISQNGILSYVLPNEFLFQIYMTKARRYYLDNARFLFAVNLGEDVFDAIVPSCIVSIQKNKSVDHLIPVADLRKSNLQELPALLATNSFDRAEPNFIRNSPNSIFSFNFSSIKLINKLSSKFDLFELYCEDIANGISTSCDGVYIVSSEQAELLQFEKEYCKPCIRGGQFNRYYCPTHSGDQVLYINSEITHSMAPNIYNYLLKNKDLLIRKSVEKRKGNRDWRILFRSRYEDLFNAPKIVIRQTADRLISALDNIGYYCIDSVNIVQLKKTHAKRACFFVGLLNSRLLNFYYREISQEGGRVLAQVKPQRIKMLPIANANPEIEENLINLVKKICLTKDKNPTADTTVSEAEVDRLVYKLYGLNATEITMVEDHFAT